MKNKKGNLHVVVLVFLILALLLLSVFTGYFMQKNAFKKYEFEKIQEVNSNKLLFEQNVYVVSKISFVKTFYEFSLGGEYDYMNGRKNTGVFSELNERLDENFNKRFKENFLDILRNANSSHPKLKSHYRRLGMDDGFDLNYSNEQLRLNFSYVSYNEQGEASGGISPSDLGIIGGLFGEKSDRPGIVGLTYDTPMEVFVNFETVSLEGFSEIYSAKEDCKSLVENDEVKSCFESRLPNFIVDVESVSDYVNNEDKSFPFQSIPEPADRLKLVRLSSKEHFVFDGEIKPIELVFVPI